MKTIFKRHTYTHTHNTTRLFNRHQRDNLCFVRETSQYHRGEYKSQTYKKCQQTNRLVYLGKECQNSHFILHNIPTIHISKLYFSSKFQQINKQFLLFCLKWRDFTSCPRTWHDVPAANYILSTLYDRSRDDVSSKIIYLIYTL